MVKRFGFFCLFVCFISNSSWTNTFIKCNKSQLLEKYKMQVQFFFRFGRCKVTVKLLWKCLNMYSPCVYSPGCRLLTQSSVCRPSFAWHWEGEKMMWTAVGKMSFSHAIQVCGIIMFPAGFLCSRHYLTCSTHINSLKFHNLSLRPVLLPFPFYRWGNGDTKQLNNSSKIPVFIRSSGKSWTWTVRTLNYY